MEISSINNYRQPFGSSIRIRKIVQGLGNELTSEFEYRGILNSLVQKLNNSPNAIETKFFKKCFKAFANSPIAAHSSIGSSRPHIYIGHEDVFAIRDLGKDVGKGDIERKRAAEIIRKYYIEPLKKKFRYSRYPGDQTGEPVALTIYANRVKSPNGHGKSYNFGIDVTDYSGKKVYAFLPSEVPEVAAKQRQLIPKENRVPQSPPPLNPGKLYQDEFGFARMIDRFNMS